MMSDRAKACYAKFKENVALAARIEEELPDDKAWSCVVRFYAAVHLRYDPGFNYTDEHHKAVRTHMERIVAIVEPKIRKA